jgi:4-diphosphocytidyl-2-C-methyl-D-erythritol kinase
MSISATRFATIGRRYGRGSHGARLTTAEGDVGRGLAQARIRPEPANATLSIFQERAYAKLNLALHVRGHLPDGRHALETIFVFCEDGDELTVQSADDFSLKVLGPFASGLTTGEDNLILVAARALRDKWGGQAGAAFRLDKRLPVAAGIGGGSADAAAALRGLTQLWTLPSLAAAVAPALSRCWPAWLRTSLGEGAGDELTSLDLPDIAGTPVLLVHPGIALSTGQVFDRWDGIDEGPIEDWRDGRNDLEAPAIGLVPQIADVLAFLKARAGATIARMSGSGATCFALFETAEQRDEAARAVLPIGGKWHRPALDALCARSSPLQQWRCRATVDRRRISVEN